MTSNETTIIAGIPISITRKPSLKNLYIRVNPPEGEVTVSAPSDASDDAIRYYVLRKIPEVTKIRNRMLSQPRQTKREFVSGETVYVWGKPYMLQVVFSGRQYHIELLEHKIIMTAPEGASDENRKHALTEWYRSQMKHFLSKLVEQCEQRTGVSANTYSIKYMKTRWGSCNIDERRILLNLQLVKKPMVCFEYVIIHELTHLIERNHTNRFNALISKFMPNWMEARQLLNEMPLDYLEPEEDINNGEDRKSQ